ncbi:MAG: hypothetical protein C4309_12865 [Chloroflexota bacterium]
MAMTASVAESEAWQRAQIRRRAFALSYLALGVGALGLGVSAIFVRWANAPGAVTSFYRMAIATALLAWPFYRRVKARGGLPRRGLWFALLGGPPGSC